ncbi:MAG: pyridoxal phosphate-dependent aminotransferase [Fibromonadaceae bacterium]|jgi:aspartate aminotransferase|nr:pyridoxal phosphate-dependent aminotransferase [Fibromonadaceae bacterium]
MKPLSKRVTEIHPSMTVEIDTLAKRLSTEGRSIWSLAIGEPNFDTSLHIKEAAINSVNKGLTRYTAPSGMQSFKEAVREKLLKENKLAYTSEQIMATSGAKHAVFNAISAIIDEGDEVLIPTPCWGTYIELVRFCGGVPIALECSIEDNFRLKTEQISKAITPKTKAIILNSPCNPTGVMYNKIELEAMAKEIVKNDLYCISDEIYEHLIYTKEPHISIATFPGMQERTVIVNGFSKTYCMTGWRIGYLAAPLDVTKEIVKMQGQTTHHPSNISQYGAVAALNGPLDSVLMMRQEFSERMYRMGEAFESIENIRFPKPEGAFYLFVDVSAYYGKKTANGTLVSNSIEFCKTLLDEQGVVIVPGAAFGLDSCVRFSFTASLPTISVAMPKFKEFVEGMK